MDRLRASWTQLQNARDAVEAARKNGALFSPMGWLLVGELQGAVDAMLTTLEAEASVTDEDLAAMAGAAAEASAPCRHYIGAEGRHCGDGPTRRYIQGPRCADHAPEMAGALERADGRS